MRHRKIPAHTRGIPRCPIPSASATLSLPPALPDRANTIDTLSEVPGRLRCQAMGVCRMRHTPFFRPFFAEP